MPGPIWTHTEKSRDRNSGHKANGLTEPSELLVFLESVCYLGASRSTLIYVHTYAVQQNHINSIEGRAQGVDSPRGSDRLPRRHENAGHVTVGGRGRRARRRFSPIRSRELIDSERSDQIGLGCFFSPESRQSSVNWNSFFLTF